jgi:predicted nucleic acid-binding protein
MTKTVFVDTNVFIYALDPGDRGKQEAANRWRAELWKSRRGRVSYQVLQEFYVKVAQKWPRVRERARAEVRDLLAWRPVAADAELIERAWKIRDRYRLSFWDALIVSAAKSASCRYLLTEDLQPNQEFDGITVINPFSRQLGDLASPR